MALIDENQNDKLSSSIESDRQHLLLRAEQLKTQVEQFSEHIADVYDGYFQEFPKHIHVSFYNDVQTEIEALKNYDPDSMDPLFVHRISSSNIPYLEAVWDAVKNSKDIVKLRHPVFNGPFKHRVLAPGIRIRDIMSLGGSEPKRNKNGRSTPPTRIDVICDGGLSWYKVSTITNRRLIFDMTKEAVYCGDSDDTDSSDDIVQDFSDVPLVKLARNLRRIAQGHQIRNYSPTPYLVLPRIVEGERFEIDELIKSCRAMGVKVITSNAISPSMPLSKDLLHEMVPSPRRNITQELNIDTSVLVALTSDISHTQMTIQSSFGSSQKDHIYLETRHPIIPTLCSLLDNHTLVCTREAALSLARIVHTMGTATENARAHLLITPDDSMTREQRVEKFRALSINGHSIPCGLQLPIRIVESEVKPNGNSLDTPHYENLKTLAQPGASVFSYGWANGLTTITCNILVIKQIEKILEEIPDLGSSEWPSIWALPSSRPLIGVPKEHSESRIRKHVGDCRVTCNCGLETFHVS